jgi:TRAP-type uncharacterized transport system substrate-binding protein
VRVIAVYPTPDRFVCAIRARTGITALTQVREQRYPLRLSIREDPTHATRPLIDEMLAAYGFSLDELQAWGGALQLVGGPRDPRRLDSLASGEVDAVMDEGVGSWWGHALRHGLRPISLDEPALQRLETIGWRRAVLPAGHVPEQTEDCMGIDFSGWALYTRASLPDAVAYNVCDAIQAQVDAIQWDETFTGVASLGQDGAATPRDVPLHPGAARWYREQGVEVS